MDEVVKNLISQLQNMMEWARELNDQQLDERRTEFVADLKASREAIVAAKALLA